MRIYFVVSNKTGEVMKTMTNKRLKFYRQFEIKLFNTKAKAHSTKYAYTFDLYMQLTLHPFARQRVDNSFARIHRIWISRIASYQLPVVSNSVDLRRWKHSTKSCSTKHLNHPNLESKTNKWEKYWCLNSSVSTVSTSTYLFRAHCFPLQITTMGSNTEPWF